MICKQIILLYIDFSMRKLGNCLHPRTFIPYRGLIVLDKKNVYHLRIIHLLIHLNVSLTSVSINNVSDCIASF